MQFLDTFLNSLPKKIFYFFCIFFALKTAIMGGGGDFKIYLEAAQAMCNHQPIYHVGFATIPGHTLEYSYSPTFALSLTPICHLPFYFIYIIWNCLNVLFIIRVFYLIEYFIPLNFLDHKKYNLFWIAIFAISITFIMHCFALIQMNIFLLWVCLESVFFIFVKKENIKPAFLVAIGIIAKLLPITILPYLFIQKKWKSLLASLIILLALFLFPLFFYSFAQLINLYKEWWSVINPSNPEFSLKQSIYADGTNGLSSLLSAIFQSHIANHFFIGIKDNEKLFSILLNSCRILFILPCLLLFTKEKKNDTRSLLTTVAYILLVTVLVFPHQQRYAFVYIIPAIYVLLVEIFYSIQINSINKKVVYGSCISLFFLLLLIFFKHFAYDIKAITLMTISMCISLFYCKKYLEPTR